jgi:hypothetical protein
MNAPTTTYRGSTIKPFSWSYSRLKNYESCPKKHYHLDVLKDVREEESEQLMFGNVLHKALADFIAKKVALPKPFAAYEKDVDAVFTFKGKDVRVIADINILVEQKLAISADFGPVDWFAKDAWFRGIGDVIWIVGPIAFIADWKTGKVLEDSQQLALMAACVFAHHPEVQVVRSEFVWLREDATTTQDFKREDMPNMWSNLWTRIKNLEHAYLTTTYPAKPGGLCKRWCPVSSCPHNGQ